MKRLVKHRHSSLVLGGFLAVTAVSVASLIYLAFHKSPMAALSLQSFSSLHEVYRTQGIQGFLREKASLKQSARAALSNDASGDSEIENIALYLFPDVLPEENLERDAGIELWGPLQAAIERMPGSPESRQKFEELRANIWNYENPSRSLPQLSPPARQVIRIYEVISAP